MLCVEIWIHRLDFTVFQVLQRIRDGRKGAVAESFDELESSTDCFFVRCGVVVVSVCCFVL